MAVTKIWPIHDNVARSLAYCMNPEKTDYETVRSMHGLRSAVAYAADKGKTQFSDESRFAVTALNCSAETAAEEMDAVKRRYGKTGGIVAYHAYQSFKPGEVSAEDCHRIGVELAKELWGIKYQVLITTHFNTGTYHNHFVVNNIGMWDGQRLPAKKALYYKMRDTSDRLCREHDLSVIEDPQRHKTARSVYFAEKNGEPTRYNLMREALDKGLSMAVDWEQLVRVMRKLGYIVEPNYGRKYPTIRSLRSKKCLRTFRLGADYDRTAIECRMEENRYNDEAFYGYREFMAQHSGSWRNKGMNPSEAETHRRRRDFYFQMTRVSGISIILRCFGVVLGLEPLENEYQKPLSPECREALRKLDRYTAELTLAGRESFKTPEDVQRFLETTEEKMQGFIADRNKIRNKQRNCRDPAERERLKRLCADCTTVIEGLRKEVKTAQNILDDNPKIKELLECEYETLIEADPSLSEQQKNVLHNVQIKGEWQDR